MSQIQKPRTVTIRRRCVLTIVHVDYLHDRSGTPKAILAQKKAFADNDVDYIGIISLQDKVRNHKIPSAACMIIVNDTIVAIKSFSCILAMLEDWTQDGIQVIGIHVHHCRYLNVKFAEALFDLFPNALIKVMLHDYYLCCTGTNLLRNDKEYCGAAPLCKEHCSNCTIYQSSLSREQLLWRMLTLYLNRITFIAPSQVAIDVFLAFHPEIREIARSRCLVMPHQKQEGNYEENLYQVSSDERLRVAYIGSAMNRKGWSIWTRLVEELQDIYDFYVFNGNGVVHKSEFNVEVNFTNTDLNAMTTALRKYKPHIAMVASTWPETYSYTYYEALSANCFVVTHRDSGNIAKQVRENKNGLVISNDQEMLDFFACPDKVRERVNTFRLTTRGGPLKLRDSEELVRLTIDEAMTNSWDYNMLGSLELTIPSDYNILALIVKTIFMKVRHYGYDIAGNIVPIC